MTAYTYEAPNSLTAKRSVLSQQKSVAFQSAKKDEKRSCGGGCKILCRLDSIDGRAFGENFAVYSLTKMHFTFKSPGTIASL